MNNKDNKILEELRRRGKIFEDPCPKSECFLGKVDRLILEEKVLICEKIGVAEAGNLNYY